MLLLRIGCFDLHSMCCVCAIRIIFLFIFFWLPLYGTFVSHVCLSVFKVRSNCGLLQRMFNICIYLMHCVNDYLWCSRPQLLRTFPAIWISELCILLWHIHCVWMLTHLEHTIKFQKQSWRRVQFAFHSLAYTKLISCFLVAFNPPPPRL